MKKSCQILLLALLTACSTATTVKGEWQGKLPVAAFDHILVVGVSDNSRMGRSFEVALADLIRSPRTRATAAVEVTDAAAMPTAESITTTARAIGADGVLVTRLVSRRVSASESESRFGVKTERPTSLHGTPGLIELFSLKYSEYEDPGELTAKSTVLLESSLYDLRQDDRLVYAITTRSKFHEGGNDDIIANVTQAIAGQLRSEALIR